MGQPRDGLAQPGDQTSIFFGEILPYPSESLQIYALVEDFDFTLMGIPNLLFIVTNADPIFPLDQLVPSAISV